MLPRHPTGSKIHTRSACCCLRNCQMSGVAIAAGAAGVAGETFSQTLSGLKVVSFHVTISPFQR